MKNEHYICIRVDIQLLQLCKEILFILIENGVYFFFLQTLSSFSLSNTLMDIVSKIR